MIVKLVPYSERFLKLSWGWLNDPEIRILANVPKFTKQDQEKWFDSLIDIENYKIWGVVYDEEPIGVCGLKKITKKDCEYWGYIGNKDYWGIGIGSNILDQLIRYAKNSGLESLWLVVINDNERAIRLYDKFGFKTEEYFDNLIKMRLSL